MRNCSDVAYMRTYGLRIRTMQAEIAPSAYTLTHESQWCSYLLRRLTTAEPPAVHHNSVVLCIVMFMKVEYHPAPSCTPCCSVALHSHNVHTYTRFYIARKVGVRWA